jgi:hypothetical protein
VTLVESCTGLAIVSVVVVFAAPPLVRARETYQLDGVARQVAGKMQWTRIKAISRNTDCRFRVSSPYSYVIECDNFGWQADQSVALPAGFRITANAAPEFHPRGNTAPAGTVTVWDKRSRQRRITVNISGRVRVD